MKRNGLILTEKTTVLWSVPVTVADIPDSGLHVEIEASAEIRAELAALGNLRDLTQFSAAFDLVRKGAGVHVSGTVEARVRQICVVTLELVQNTVVEPVDLLFSPAGTGEADLDATEVVTEPPEYLTNGQLDLGALATEFLMLGIDPYPRKPGAEFTPPKVEEMSEGPFAALAGLKKKQAGER